MEVTVGVGEEGKIGPFSPLTHVACVVGNQELLNGKCDVVMTVLGVPGIYVVSSTTIIMQWTVMV